MMSVRRRVVLSLPVCLLWFIGLGCRSQSTSFSPAAANTPSPEAVAAQLRTIAAAGTLADLTLPGFPNYSQPVQELYEAVGYAPVWVRGGQATSQAQAIITAFEASRTKGLNPEEYDASRWSQRLNALKNTPGDPTTVAHFDAALTVNAMRYISDLRVGRVNPKHFKFGIDISQKTYDLSQFLLQKVVPAGD